MSVKLRLKRLGRSNHSFFRLNAIDSRSPRDGRVIEELGYYDPRNKDQAKQFIAKLERCRYWMDHGAIPSQTVSSLLKKSGVEHKMLRLPKPGKPKAVVEPAAGAKKKEEAVTTDATTTEATASAATGAEATATDAAS